MDRKTEGREKKKKIGFYGFLGILFLIAFIFAVFKDEVLMQLVLAFLTIFSLFLDYLARNM